jgi:hypothetical protein
VQQHNFQSLQLLELVGRWTVVQLLDAPVSTVYADVEPVSIHVHVVVVLHMVIQQRRTQ